MTQSRLPPTYTNKLCEWLVITIKDNKLIEIGFLKNESQTMMTAFVLKVQSQSLIILGIKIYKYMPTIL